MQKGFSAPGMHIQVHPALGVKDVRLHLKLKSNQIFNTNNLHNYWSQGPVDGLFSAKTMVKFSKKCCKSLKKFSVESIVPTRMGHCVQGN